eukprot:GHVS01078629.1.p1 GENE.GHVS01078629.1~~GHVS01078629.1.p1  ORF type:complete len:336 (+),score=79.05 GHVS01078629.1:190-1197(+)
MGDCISTLRRLPVIVLSRLCPVSSSSSSLPFLYHAAPSSASSPLSSSYALQDPNDLRPHHHDDVVVGHASGGRGGRDLLANKSTCHQSTTKCANLQSILSSSSSSSSSRRCFHPSSSPATPSPSSPSANCRRLSSFSLPSTSSSSPVAHRGGGHLCILLCGAQRSGKTALLYRAKLSAFILTLPTREVMKESFQMALGPEDFLWWVDIWDTGKKGPEDAVWREVHQMCNAVVFAIDSLDRRKLEQVRSNLLDLFYEEHFVLQPQIRFLLFCTKQDAISAMSPAEIESALDLPADVRQRCSVMGCSAMSGDGIREGLEWLAGTAWVPMTPKQTPAT